MEAQPCSLLWRWVRLAKRVMGAAALTQLSLQAATTCAKAFGGLAIGPRTAGAHTAESHGRPAASVAATAAAGTATAAAAPT